MFWSFVWFFLSDSDDRSYSVLQAEVDMERKRTILSVLKTISVTKEKRNRAKYTARNQPFTLANAIYAIIHWTVQPCSVKNYFRFYPFTEFIFSSFFAEWRNSYGVDWTWIAIYISLFRQYVQLPSFSTLKQCSENITCALFPKEHCDNTFLRLGLLCQNSYFRHVFHKYVEIDLQVSVRFFVIFFFCNICIE